MTEHNAAAPYRMADLVEMAGVPRETIHYYMREGLLPKPVKSARNMAWYNDSHVEQLHLIRSLQEEQLLPLKAIKALLNDPKEYPFTPRQRGLITRIRQHHQVSMRQSPKQMPDTAKAIASKYQVPTEDLLAMKKAGFISVSPDECPTAEEAECIQLWGALSGAGMTKQLGFTPDDLSFLQTAIDLLFDQEVRLFSERLGDMEEKEIEPLLNTAIPAVSRLLAILHERKISGFLDTFDQFKN